MGAVRPKSHWGQNFLRRDETAARIVELMGVSPDSRVLEIGPGTGALTGHLLRTGAQIDCIEIDPELCELLEGKFASHDPGPRIVNKDILQYDLRELGHGKVRVVTNAPYNISSKLLDYFCRQAPFITDIHVMLQREVGEMLLARPGTKTYKHMSVLMLLSFEMESLMEVPRHLFYPEPKVDSVFLRLVPGPQLGRETSASLNRLLAAAFGNRRKKLRNALGGVWGEAARAMDFDLERRAEQVEPEEYLALAGSLPGRGVSSTINLS